MKTARRPTYSFLILVIGLIIIDTLLAWFFLQISPTTATGVAVIGIAAAFMVLFTLWFGMYGAIAAFVGGVLGSGLLSGLPASVSVYSALADLWLVLVPLVAFRIFEVNPAMESRRDLFHLVLFGIIINNLIAASWGAISLALGKVILWNEIMAAFLPWFIGNVIFSVIIVPFLLRRYTPAVSRSKVYVKNYWF